MSPRRALMLVLTAVPAGCSLLVDSGGLSDDGDDGDGSALDVVASDAAVQADADAGPAPSPCDEPHLFCDDFDRGALGASWDKKEGTVFLDPALARSAPNGLRARVDVGTGERPSRLYKRVGSVPLSCEFQMQVLNRGGPGGQAELFGIQLQGSPVTTYVVVFGVTPAGSYFGELTFPDPDAGSGIRVKPVANLRDKTWTRVAVEVSATGAKLRYDGVEMSSIPLTYPGSTSPTVFTGIAMARNGGPFDVVVDDFFCD